MVFALGFLTAALLALFVLPALSRRAELLARRRVEARFPASLAEIAAERDHFRAELAVEARKVEQRAEAAALARAGDLAELGRRAVLIADQQTELATRAGTIESLGADLAATRLALAETQATLQATQTDLATRSRELGERSETLSALETAHRDLNGVAEERRIVIAALETTAEGLRARIGELERDLGIARETINLRDISLAELETRKAVLEHRVAALEHERDDRDRLIETLRAEREAVDGRIRELEAEVADVDIHLAAAMERGDRYQAQLERVSAEEHAASSELASHLEDLRNAKAAAEGALEAARTERRGLRREIAQLREALAERAGDRSEPSPVNAPEPAARQDARRSRAVRADPEAVPGE